MGWVETASPDAGSASGASPAFTTPPRPERRRVAVSLLLTLSVLVGTVVTIYAVFPARHNVLVTRSLEAHRAPAAPQLVRPTRPELHAFGLALLDRPVPWPELDPDHGEILSATSMSVLSWRAAVVRYRLRQGEVSLVVQRARSAPPRVHRRVDGEAYVVSWRHGPFTFVAVGPVAGSEAWTRALGVP